MRKAGLLTENLRASFALLVGGRCGRFPCRGRRGKGIWGGVHEVACRSVIGVVCPFW